MKPHRLKLAHHLLLSYNLYREMDVYRPHLATSAVSPVAKIQTWTRGQGATKLTPNDPPTSATLLERSSHWAAPPERRRALARKTWPDFIFPGEGRCRGAPPRPMAPRKNPVL